MNDEDIKRAVRQTMMEILELEPAELEDSAHFDTDMGGDSIQKLELVVALEKKFNIHYTADEAVSMNSVNEVVQVTKHYV